MSIPIKDAVIAWGFVTGNAVKVFRKGEHIPSNYDFTEGACYEDWKRITDGMRLVMIEAKAWHLVCDLAFDPVQVHTAFLIIPEYSVDRNNDSAGKAGCDLAGRN